MVETREPHRPPHTGLFIRTRLLPMLLCVLAVSAAAFFAVVGVPPVEREFQEWQAASPCLVTAPVNLRDDCVTTVHAVVERTKVEPDERDGDDWLYFRSGDPVDRVNVSYNTAAAFGPGDHVTLTWWRGNLMKVAGAQYTADEGVPSRGAAAFLVAVAILGVAYFTLFALVYHPRNGRPVAAGEPAQASVFVFVTPLIVAALWVLPLAVIRPDRTVAVPVAAGGGLVVLAVLVQAWRASGRTPPVRPRSLPEGEDVFLRAFYLQNGPRRTGPSGTTHIVLGAGPMAALPHGGPDRFAAKEIPAGRLTLNGIRRPYRRTERMVPPEWYVAELLDSGTLVRLAAAPEDLLLLVQELERARPAAGGTE